MNQVRSDGKMSVFHCGNGKNIVKNLIIEENFIVLTTFASFNIIEKFIISAMVLRAAQLWI